MEAAAGRAALESLKGEAARLKEANERLEKQNKQLEKEILQLKIAAGEEYAKSATEQKMEIGLIPFVGVQFQGRMQHESLRATADWIQKKEEKAVTFLMDQGGYCVATSSGAAQKRGIAANELLKAATEAAGGSGGGRPNIAQGRIDDPSRFSEIKRRLVLYIKERVQ